MIGHPLVIFISVNICLIYQIPSSSIYSISWQEKIERA